MRKIYKLGLSLGATASIVAPLTTMACNNKETQDKGGKGAVPASVVTKWTPKVDYSEKLSQKLSEMKDVNTAALNIGTVDKTQYSIDTLKAEAESIYGSNKPAIWAGWRSNPLNASIFSIASLIRALSNAYGYDVKVNGVSPKDEFLKNQYQAIVTDEASIDSSIQDENVQNQMKLLSSLKQKDLQTPSYLPFSIGETTQGITRIMDLVGVDYSAHPETHVGKSVFDLLEDPKFSVWDDEKNPGQAVMSIYTNTGLYKEVQLKNVKDMYAIIEPKKFEDEYIPYVKNAFVNFVKLLKDNSSALFIGGIDLMLFNQIQFLIEKNMDSSNEFKFDDTKLTSVLKTFNNGSFNWLAIKALSKGFDKSMTSGFYSLLTNGSGGLKQIAYGQELKGIDNWDATDFTQWLGWADAGKGYINEDSGTQVFNAVDLIDETYLTNKIPVDTINSIKQYITDKENTTFDINAWVKDTFMGQGLIELPFGADNITLDINENVKYSIDHIIGQADKDAAQKVVKDNIDKVKLSSLALNSQVSLKDLALYSYSNDQNKMMANDYEVDHQNRLPEFLKLPGAKMTVKSVDSANGSIVVTISCQTYSHDFTIDGYNKNS